MSEKPMSENMTDEKTASDKTINALFEELKKDLDFLPDNEAARNGFIFSLKYMLARS
ncbi:hypothetical protein [Desulfosporosinus fructosivorans]